MSPRPDTAGPRPDTASARPDSAGARPDGASPRPDTAAPRPDATGQRPDGSTPPRQDAPSSRPDGARPDGTRPDGDRPANTRPDGTNPQSQHPDTTRPDGTRPDQNQPDSRPKDSTDQRQDSDTPRDRDSDAPRDKADADPGTPERQHQIEQAESTRQQTPAGSAYHNDPNMRDLASRVPDDGVHHTVDVHALPDGRVRVGDQTFTPKEFADMLRRDPNWDGSKPLRLLSCDAGTSGLARDLSRELGIPVTAPRGLAWTDGNGRVFASDMGPDGKPGWPPNGGWDTHNPDGTTTPASNDGFHPSRDGADPGQRPEDAEARGRRQRDDADGDGDEPPRQRQRTDAVDETERQRRKDKLPSTHQLYGAEAVEARTRAGQTSDGPLRWDPDADSGSGDWKPAPTGPLQPIASTPAHIQGQMLNYVYGSDRPSFSAETKYTVYGRTGMNPDGSYVCSTSGNRIPVQAGDPPQFYDFDSNGKRVAVATPDWFTRGEDPPAGTTAHVGPQFHEMRNGQRTATSPPDWYMNGENPPAPPHSKFVLPEKDAAHMGHKPDYEYWRQQRFALFHEMTVDQYRAIYDNPDHYHLEEKSANESHGHESTTPGYGNYPALARNLFPTANFQPIPSAPTNMSDIYKGSKKLGDPRG
ncbi:hypothetical protein HUO13_06695 [Saccharopolyspora erythraea]|uniref:GH-E family nuclease n=1 Tax=Saccharopolyspora erythraea TaxID=1836 RepID=UPI001BAAE225|nr:GH-E family nuclease [Saccharopolyspora erythraea]QUH00547.1 hypothetical protein HUO13_06695 [Saccharopolyspora erythraea]